MTEAEIVHTSRKKHVARIQKRIKALKGSTLRQDDEIIPIDEVTIYGNRTLARLFGVREETIWNWKRKGIIQGKELARGMFSYRMKNVLRDLERYCDDDYK